jgi:hypothetical protein
VVARLPSPDSLRSRDVPERCSKNQRVRHRRRRAFRLATRPVATERFTMGRASTRRSGHKAADLEVSSLLSLFPIRVDARV